MQIARNDNPAYMYDYQENENSDEEFMDLFPKMFFFPGVITLVSIFPFVFAIVMIFAVCTAFIPIPIGLRFIDQAQGKFRKWPFALGTQGLQSRKGS